MKTPFRARWPWSAPANFWISGRPTVVVPALGLNEDYVEAEAILVDDAVDSTVAAPPDRAASILTTTSVTRSSRDRSTTELLEGRQAEATADLLEELQLRASAREPRYAFEKPRPPALLRKDGFGGRAAPSSAPAPTPALIPKRARTPGTALTPRCRRALVSLQGDRVRAA